MGAKHFGARVTRLEDPALLAGRGRFVDDVKLPGMLHACFVRSPHAPCRCSRYRQPSKRWRCPACMRCSPPTTCPSRCAASRCRCSLPNPSIATPRTQHGAGARRSLLCRPAVAVVIADTRYHRRGRRRRRSIVDYEVLAAVGDCRAAIKDGAPRAHSDLARTSSPAFRWLTATSTPPSPAPRMFSTKCSGSTAAAAWRWRRAPCWPVTIRCRTCSRYGPARRRRISAAACSPICSTAISNRSA